MFKARALFFLALLLPSSLSAGSTPKFRTGVIELAGESIQVQIADTPEQQAHGLMYRTTPLAENEGMLFRYPREKTLQFWMKNTKIPLSIAFFDAQRRLVDIQDMPVDPPMLQDSARPRYRSRKPAKYALETRRGWFEKRQIRADSNVAFQLIQKTK